MSGPADDLLSRDSRVVWHPYTQHGQKLTPLPVAGAEGSVLELVDGRRILDGISSWWTCLHGHGEPAIARAIAEQATSLDHVLFAGATHEPAVGLAEDLLALAPEGLSRVFYSDDGSTAVEVALKIARQAFVQRGEAQRDTFVALEGGYHGDTFGAMAVGDPDPFFVAYAPMLFDVRRIKPQPAALAAALDELGERAAGVIIEPLVQGAAGMRCHPVEFVRAVEAECNSRGLPFIADEVMTGFGRTGTVFACEQAGVRPDLMCLSKGLTGGVLPLAVTLATDELFQAFVDDDRSRMFFHGHSFTANPIGCAAARASTRLLRANDTPARLAAIGRTVEDSLRANLAPGVELAELRRIGGIVAFDRVVECDSAAGYLAGEPARLMAKALDMGVLLRPLGQVIYAMPPASTTPEQAARIGAAMALLAGPV